MTEKQSAWLDREYNPLLAVPDAAALFADWNRRSAATRQANPHHSDISYGPSAGQVLDVFPSPRPNTPVLVFIHGGFWGGSDKSAHSFLAPAFTSRGAIVVLLNYGLCPAVQIETILQARCRRMRPSWPSRQCSGSGLCESLDELTLWGRILSSLGEEFPSLNDRFEGIAVVARQRPYGHPAIAGLNGPFLCRPTGCQGPWRSVSVAPPRTAAQRKRVVM